MVENLLDKFKVYGNIKQKLFLFGVGLVSGMFFSIIDRDGIDNLEFIVNGLPVAIPGFATNYAAYRKVV